MLATFVARTAQHYRDCAQDRESEPPKNASLGHGTAGVAYFLLRHASITGDESMLAAADRWADRAARAASSPGAFELPLGYGLAAPTSLPYSEPGVWWTRALVATATKDHDVLSHAIERFAGCAEAAVGDPGDVNLGSAGLLLGCSGLVETVRDTALLTSLRSVGDRLAAELVELGEREGPSCRESAIETLGPSHGWGGIAHTLLRWSAATGAPRPDTALALLEELITLRRKSGRVPVRVGSREVGLGWCHGSAGWAETWAWAWRCTGDDRYLELAEASATDAVTDRDCYVSLCCGRSSEGYAALALYRATGDGEWRATAERVAREAVELRSKGSPPPGSLFMGALGAALLAAEVAEPARSAMPVYESLADT